MAKERRHNGFFPPSKRPKEELSAENVNARKEYVNVDTDRAVLGKNHTLTVAEANAFLSRLEGSFNKSTPDQWFHFAAKKLFLDIIRKVPNPSELNSPYQLTTEQLREGYIALTTSPLFAKRGNAEQRHILGVISKLNEKITQKGSQEPEARSSSALSI
jgi:hypothetical protein